MQYEINVKTYIYNLISFAMTRKFQNCCSRIMNMDNKSQSLDLDLLFNE